MKTRLATLAVAMLASGCTSADAVAQYAAPPPERPTWEPVAEATIDQDSRLESFVVSRFSQVRVSWACDEGLTGLDLRLVDLALPEWRSPLPLGAPEQEAWSADAIAGERYLQADLGEYSLEARPRGYSRCTINVYRERPS